MGLPVLALLLLVLLAALLTHAWRRNPADLARKADSANHDARQTVLSFWEMSRSPFAAESSGHSLGAWLMGKRSAPPVPGWSNTRRTTACGAC